MTSKYFFSQIHRTMIDMFNDDDDADNYNKNNNKF